MANILPTDAELATLATLNDVRQWSGLPQAVWDRVSATLGQVPSLRVFVMVPLTTLQALGVTVRIPLTTPDTDGNTDRALTAVELIQVALMWRVSRQAFRLEDLDPLTATGPTGSTGSGPAAPATSSSPTKKIKVSSHADQLDDTELELLSAEEIDKAYANHREATGADPLPEADPSAEQVSVLFGKIVKRSESPYADFSVLTPFGRRVQKQMKARNFLLQPDGSWKTVEIPGPQSYESWKACWRVFRTVLLMLKHDENPAGIKKPVATVAALEEYHEKIYELTNEFPECWHLVMQAEDRARSEYFERIRRDLVRARLEGRLPMNVSFDPEQPWVGVFTYMARNADYWNKFVVRPAQTFLARGGAGKAMSPEDALESQVSKAANMATKNVTGAAVPPPPAPFGEGLSKTARRKRKERERAREEDAKSRSRSAPWHSGGGNGKGSGGAGGAGSGKGGGHPRKSGKEFQTTREGIQICFRYAKGQPGVCAEPCQDSRAHCCQYCLGPHPNVQCPNAPGRKSGKGDNK